MPAAAGDICAHEKGFQDMLDRTHEPVGPGHVLHCPMVRYMEPVGPETGLVGHLKVRTVDSAPSFRSNPQIAEAMRAAIPEQDPEDLGPRTGDLGPRLK